MTSVLTGPTSTGKTRENYFEKGEDVEGGGLVLCEEKLIVKQIQVSCCPGSTRLPSWRGRQGMNTCRLEKKKPINIKVLELILLTSPLLQNFCPYFCVRNTYY